MRIRILGFGSIGRGLLSFLIHKGFNPRLITVFDKDDTNAELARQQGAQFAHIKVARDNYQWFVRTYCKAGDVLLNLAVEVSSINLLETTAPMGVHYLDTCVEPWTYRLSRDMRTNAELRTSILNVARVNRNRGHVATSLIAHGANPGLITYFVKMGLHHLADKFNLNLVGGVEQYGLLAREIGVRVVQVAEHDTQTDDIPHKPGEFHNTWSVDGFKSELYQDAELGLGSHEYNWQDLTTHIAYEAEACAITLRRPARTAGYQQRVKTWTPGTGPSVGWLITHHEALSVNAMLRITTDDDGALNEVEHYAPTVYYAYQPCAKAQQAIQEMPCNSKAVIMKPTAGYDQLGALLMYDGKHGSGAIWVGSTLDVKDCTIRNNPPTTQQVTASIWAGIEYMLSNPERGVLEAEDLPWHDMLNLISPYLGHISVEETDWNPGSLQLQDFLIN